MEKVMTDEKITETMENVITDKSMADMMVLDHGKAAVSKVDKQQEDAYHLEGECLGDLLFNIQVQ